MKKGIIFLLSASFFLLLFSNAEVVQADCNDNPTPGCPNYVSPSGGSTFTSPSGGSTFTSPSSGSTFFSPSGSAGSQTIQNPLKVNSIGEFISALLKAIIAIGIPIAILFIVLAGFKFIAAQGNPEDLKKARQNFLYVVIGIAIFIGAYALAELIMATLRQIGVNV